MNAPSGGQLGSPDSWKEIYSGDGGVNWAVENTGFANVIVQSLTIAKDENNKRYLCAFTHGRSAYRVTLAD